MWYQTPTPTNADIKIIAIDEKTIDEYGDIKTWTREIPARLVELLNRDRDLMPSAIVFDVMYIGDVEEESDARFAEACREGNNVVTAVNIVYRTRVELTDSGSLTLVKNNVDMVEYPYDELKEASFYGFANTIQDSDGYIRYTKTDVKYEGEVIDSLPMAAYRMYCGSKGIEPVRPKVFKEGLFSFTYSGKSGSYETISLCDVLDGTVDPRNFAGKAVFVGAYAPGTQDAYNVAVQKGAQMYGVEIHANILEALMEGKTGIPVNVLLYSLAVALVAAAFYLICGRMKIIPSALLGAGLITADMLVCRGLYRYVSGLIDLPVCLILVYICQMVRGYLREILRRKKVVSAFKKYVAPQVVDEISRQGDFKLVLGGENRHVAVLFVDIRGFTPCPRALSRNRWWRY